MRRAILAVTGTVAGLAALLSFKSHVPSLPSAAAASGGTGTGGGAPAPGPSSSSAGQGQGFTTGALTGLPAGETTVTGKVADTAYGPVQIELAVRSSKIVKVSVLQQPTSTIHDIQIGQFAFPRLIGETLAAQSAKIDAVSGATYTSQGYIQSLQSAVDQGA
jgi:uncharacterized protein with FMN-binding domain